MIKNKSLPRRSLTISGTKQPALCYDYSKSDLISEPKETKRTTREENKTFAPGKRERDTKKYAKRAATSFSPSREVFRR